MTNPIPAFLKKPQPTETILTNEPPKPERKKRTVQQLPTSIGVDDDGDAILIEKLSLETLIEIRAKIKAQLEDVPRLELELKAVVKEIGKKARE